MLRQCGKLAMVVQVGCVGVRQSLRIERDDFGWHSRWF